MCFLFLLLLILGILCQKSHIQPKHISMLKTTFLYLCVFNYYNQKVFKIRIHQVQIIRISSDFLALLYTTSDDSHKFSIQISYERRAYIHKGCSFDFIDLNIIVPSQSSVSVINSPPSTRSNRTCSQCGVFQSNTIVMTNDTIT